MLKFTTGNLLDSDAEALVNTVNTVGVMGKGIALMFKEKFPENYRAYREACKSSQVVTGRVFVTEIKSLVEKTKWVVNFPTKRDWRGDSKLEWIEAGLESLKDFLVENDVKSVALPPLGSGNGGLNWNDVKPVIVKHLQGLDVDVLIYEPTSQYQNVAKKSGVEKLTPARALVAELVRRYLVVGMECTLLEVQKLAYFLERNLQSIGQSSALDLRFQANKFGPYAQRLAHLLDSLDGSYLHCSRRIADAGALEPIWFEDEKSDHVATYLSTEGKHLVKALDGTTAQIDGFESPFGLELLSTVDWLITHESAHPTVESVREGLGRWPGGHEAGRRKLQLFDDRLISLALHRLANSPA